MSLLFMDGFNYAAGTNIVGIGKWQAGTLSANATAPAPRSGPSSGALNQILTCTTKTLTTSGGIVIGYARLNSNPSTANFLQVQEGGTIHLTLNFEASGVISVRRGGTTLLGSSASVIATVSSWQFFEFKAIIDDAAGSYEVRVDGVTVLTGSGVDTRNGGTGVWDRVVLHGGGVNPSTCLIDDLYILDTSGSAPYNDFLGNVRVETLFPQTDAVATGSNAGLTPSTGTDHGALVDETNPNTTDYNSHATVGQKDTYQFPSMTFSGTIYGIQTAMYVSKSDAAVRSVRAVVRTGGTDYDGANVSPTTTFVTYTEARSINPNTGVAWVAADINAIEAGMKVTV